MVLWLGFSDYADQFEMDRASYRITMLGVMLGISVLALMISRTLCGTLAEFATIYTDLQLVIIALYI